MHTDISFLKDIVIIFALASFVIWLFHKLRVPSIIGFLLTGILTGPFAFGLVKSVDEIEVLAEIGVVLLLFTIGIEFSLRNLISIRRLVFLGGFLQVSFTTLFTFLISYFFGRPVDQSLFFGFLAALSSTAVVLKILQERAEIAEDYGKFSVGVLIFQDLIIVPMILVIPLISGYSENPGQDILIMVLKLAALGLLTFAGAKYFVPWMLHQVARTQNQELFLLSVLMLGLAVAVITSSMGLSLALGAFLAGLTISESEYSHQAFGNIIPVRDIFTSFFFVSIGMLFDVGYVFSHLPLVLLAAIVVLIVKTFISGFVAFLLGFPFRTTVLAGLALSQVGEFSFILARFGMNFDLIDDNFYRLFIAVSVMTMALAPFVIMLAPRLATWLGKLPIPLWLEKGLNPPVYDQIKPHHNHLIIIGYGQHGRHVAQAAGLAGIRYLILDNDPDLVRSEREAGENIYFGDAVHEAVLKQAGTGETEALVITPSNSATVYSITALARKMNPEAYILVRAGQIEDIEDLYKIGASEVIPAEFGTSVEIFARVLSKFLVPEEDIDKFISRIRSDGYRLFRNPEQQPGSMRDLRLRFPDLEITAVRLHPRSNAEGRTIAETELRTRFGVTLVAVTRNEENIQNPASGFVLLAGDIVYVMGRHEQVRIVMPFFLESDVAETP